MNEKILQRYLVVGMSTDEISDTRAHNQSRTCIAVTLMRTLFPVFGQDIALTALLAYP